MCLLQLLIGYWDPKGNAFMLDGQTLKIEVEDIYIFTRLSCRGEVPSLKAHSIGEIKINAYMEV